METNQKVNDTYSNMQMPTVEHKVIVIDDYSTYGRALGSAEPGIALLIRRSRLLQP